MRLLLLSLSLLGVSEAFHPSLRVIEKSPVARTVQVKKIGIGFSYRRAATRLLARIDQEDGVSRDFDSFRGPLTIAALAVPAFLYWYWLVLGAAVHANGLPGVPDFIPMSPGWPPTESDLQGPLEDSPHFFYLSELIGNKDAPLVTPPRLALFNVAEAWIFSFLPALWKDPFRLPRPALLGLWAILGINLTNAFLAPYLLLTAAFVSPSAEDDPREKNVIVSSTMGAVATAVFLFALFQAVTETTPQEWESLGHLCREDRTYLAFVVDLFLFSLFQPYILRRADCAQANRPVDFVPFVGTLAWLFRR